VKQAGRGRQTKEVRPSVPALLRAHGLHPRKSLGQNFLIDPVALGRIVTAAELSSDDVVVEVGAGLGTLTRPLAERSGHVIALELDDHLVEILREQLADLPNVEIVHGDVLQFSGSPSPRGRTLSNRSYKVISNLPYQITSAVLRHFLEKEPRPLLMVVTVQREVAERIVSGPGKMSLLAVSVQFYGQPRLVARIPAGAFYPPPQVDSAVVRIDVRERPEAWLEEEADVGRLDETAFFRVVRAGFSQKRKTLRNSLSAGLGLSPVSVEDALERAGVNPQRRAETLSLQEWARVVSSFGTHAHQDAG
jgi:16S rRNA (adenine1518-N6/adenine1519-N6)-dimethyltransferase